MKSRHVPAFCTGFAAWAIFMSVADLTNPFGLLTGVAIAADGLAILVTTAIAVNSWLRYAEVPK